MVWGVDGKATARRDDRARVPNDADRPTHRRPGFGVGAQLMQPAPKAARAPPSATRQHLLRFSATDNSSTASAPKKGDIAITRRRVGTSYPRAW